MIKQLRDVLEFITESGGSPKTEVPNYPSKQIQDLARRLVAEESRELCEALEVDDLAHIAKEAVDVIYVVLWTCLYHGIPLLDVWDEVQRTNMLKRFPDGTFHHDPNIDNKVIKPPGWKPPDVEYVLKETIKRYHSRLMMRNFEP